VSVRQQPDVANKDAAGKSCGFEAFEWIGSQRRSLPICFLRSPDVVCRGFLAVKVIR